MTHSASAVAQSGTFAIGGDLPVHRLGYGAMQLTGPGVWGPPRDHDEAIRVLRRAVELGVNLIDTADSYGPFVADAPDPRGAAPLPRRPGDRHQGRLHPPGAGPVGAGRAARSTCASRWSSTCATSASSASTCCSCTASTRRCRWRTRSASWPRCRARARSATSACPRCRSSTSRPRGRSRRSSRCRTATTSPTAPRATCSTTASGENIAFIPWFPLATGELAGEGSPVAEARRGDRACRRSQLALAWLLHRSPVILPIPGTSSVAHLEDNVAAAGVSLTDDEMAALTEAAG